MGRGQWPDGVLVQTCGMGKDPFFALAGGLDAARELAATGRAPAGRPVRLPSPSAPVHRQLAAVLRPGATALGLQRSREFLDGVS